MKGKAPLCTPCTDRRTKLPRPRWRCMCTGRGEGLRCVMAVQQGDSCGNCFFDEGESFHCDCNCKSCGDPTSEDERSSSIDTWDDGLNGRSERNPPTDAQMHQMGRVTTEEGNRQGYVEGNSAAAQSVQQHTCTCVFQCTRPAEVTEHSIEGLRWFCTDCIQYECECNCDRCVRANDYNREENDATEQRSTTDAQTT